MVSFVNIVSIEGAAGMLQGKGLLFSLAFFEFNPPRLLLCLISVISLDRDFTRLLIRLSIIIYYARCMPIQFIRNARRSREEQRYNIRSKMPNKALPALRLVTFF